MQAGAPCLQVTATMKKTVFILDRDPQNSRRLGDLLTLNGYASRTLADFQSLETGLLRSACLAVILNIDSIQPDRHRIRRLQAHHPGLYILCVSEKSFHPQLKDMIQEHIYACLKKPVDGEELVFWLKSIEKN